MTMKVYQVPLDAPLTCPRGDGHRVYQPDDNVSDTSFDVEEPKKFADWPVEDEASGSCAECGFPLFLYYHDLVRPEAPHVVDLSATVETTGAAVTVGLTTDDSENEEQPEPSFGRTPEKWKLALAGLIVLFISLFIFTFLVL